MDVSLDCIWRPLLEGTTSTLLQPAPEPAATTTGKQKTSKADTKKAQALVAATSLNEPTPRSNGFVFCFKDSIFILGGGENGALDCYSVTPSSSSASTGSPTKGKDRTGSPKKASKKDTANGVSQSSLRSSSPEGSKATTGTMVSALQNCSGKAPPPRQWFAACTSHASGSSPSTATTSNTTSSTSAATGTTTSSTCDVPSKHPVTSVFVCGGHNTTGGLDDVWELKVPQFSWQQHSIRPPLISKRYHHATAHVEGKLFVFGGCDARTECVLGDFWILDDSAGMKKWVCPIGHGACHAGSVSGVDDDSVVQGLRPCARQQHTMAAAPHGTLLLFGGVSSAGEVLCDLWQGVVHNHVKRSLHPPSSVADSSTSSSVITLTSSLVFWRKVDVYGGASLPRRFGVVMLVAPIPAANSDGENKPQEVKKRQSVVKLGFSRPSNLSGATNSASEAMRGSTTDFLILLCGGWDALTMSPFPKAVASAPAAAANSSTLQRSHSMFFDDHAGSFRGSVSETLMTGQGSPASLAHIASQRHGSNAAVSWQHERIAQQQLLVVPLLATSAAGVVTNTRASATTTSKEILLDANVALDNESVCSSKAYSFASQLQHQSSPQRNTTQISVSSKALSVMDKFFRRQVDLANDIAEQNRPLTVSTPSALCVKLIDAVSSGTNTTFGGSNVSPPGSPTTAVDHASLRRSIDVSVSVNAKGGPAGVASTATVPCRFSRDGMPMAGVGSMWCRGPGIKPQVYCFGGQMCPMVLRSDLWKCDLNFVDWVDEFVSL